MKLCVLCDAFAVLLFLASLSGAALFLAPGRAFPILSKHYGWARLRSAASALDTVYRIERLFYRRHRYFGALLLLGAGYAVFGLWGPLFDPVHGAGPGKTAFMALLVGNGLAWFLGVAVLLRPSLLKEPERVANRWVGLPRVPSMGKEVDTNEPVGHHPRLVGAFILGGALYALVNLVKHC
jgi:hypothetical protein